MTLVLQPGIKICDTVGYIIMARNQRDRLLSGEIGQSDHDGRPIRLLLLIARIAS